MKGLLNKPSRIATLLKLFQQTPPRGVADNEQVGGALSRLAQNIRPQDPNNMLEEFANLPGHALANTIDAGAALIQPDQLVKAAQQVYRDPQPAIQGLKDFGAEVAERPVALMEQLDFADLIPGLAALPPGSNKFLKTIGKADRKKNLDEFLSTSQLRDSDDIPVTAHHATTGDFTEFDPNHQGQPKATWDQVDGSKRTYTGESGDAIWLSARPANFQAAHNFSDSRAGANVKPLHVNASNPLILDDTDALGWAQDVFADGNSEFPYLISDEARRAIMNEGHDSIFLHYSDKVRAEHDAVHKLDEFVPDEIIVFDSSQLKSKTGNDGSFSKNSKNIVRAAAGISLMSSRGNSNE